MTDLLRVIDVGAGAESVAHLILGDELEMHDVITMDIHPDAGVDIVQDITEEMPDYLCGAFDIVVMNHVLEHIDYFKVGKTIANVLQLLAPMGEAHIVVPDMEWACRKVLKGENNIAVAGVIWGGQNHEWDYHRSGFSLLQLRQLMETTGLTIRYAGHGKFGIQYTADGESKILEAHQNYVVGFIAEKLMEE